MLYEVITLAELQALSGLANRDMRSQLFFSPEVEAELQAFEQSALASTRSGAGRLLELSYNFV